MTLRNVTIGSRDTQWLVTLVAPVADQGLITSTHKGTSQPSLTSVPGTPTPSSELDRYGGAHVYV